MGLLFWHCVHDQWTRLTDFHLTIYFNYYITIFIRYNKKCWWRLPISSWNTARISESVSIKVALFSLCMFRYSLYTHQPGKTFSLTASIVLFSDPLKLLLQYPQSKISWTPGSFVTHQTQIVLIAAHFWDNIPWEFSGCWKVLQAKIDYMMYYYF